MPSIAPFVASSDEAVKRMLKLAKPKPGEVLFDLGCGDGKIITTAAKEYGVKAVGIELREDLVKRALERVHALGLDQNVKVVHGDIFDQDIGDADVVTLYLTTHANEQIKPKLEKELKPGSRVVSNCYEIPGWKPVQVDDMGFSKIYLYVKK